MIQEIGSSKDDVALELLRTNFGMIKDAIASLRDSIDRVTLESNKLRDKVDEEIMPIVLNQHRDIEILRDSMKELAKSSSEFAITTLSVSESVKKKIGLFESFGTKIIGSMVGIYFSIRIVNDLGIGSMVAKILGW